MDLFRAAHEKIPIPERDLSPPKLYVRTQWKERYDVGVVYENGAAAYLDFRDERHFIIFSLQAR